MSTDKPRTVDDQTPTYNEEQIQAMLSISVADHEEKSVTPTEFTNNLDRVINLSRQSDLSAEDIKRIIRHHYGKYRNLVLAEKTEEAADHFFKNDKVKGLLDEDELFLAEIQFEERLKLEDVENPKVRDVLSRYLQKYLSEIDIPAAGYMHFFKRLYVNDDAESDRIQTVCEKFYEIDQCLEKNPNELDDNQMKQKVVHSYWRDLKRLIPGIEEEGPTQSMLFRLMRAVIQGLVKIHKTKFNGEILYYIQFRPNIDHEKSKTWRSIAYKDFKAELMEKKKMLDKPTPPDPKEIEFQYLIEEDQRILKNELVLICHEAQLNADIVALSGSSETIEQYYDYVEEILKTILKHIHSENTGLRNFFETFLNEFIPQSREWSLVIDENKRKNPLSGDLFLESLLLLVEKNNPTDPEKSTDVYLTIEKIKERMISIATKLARSTAAILKDTDPKEDDDGIIATSEEVARDVYSIGHSIGFERVNVEEESGNGGSGRTTKITQTKVKKRTRKNDRTMLLGMKPTSDGYPIPIEVAPKKVDPEAATDVEVIKGPLEAEKVPARLPSKVADLALGVGSIEKQPRHIAVEDKTLYSPYESGLQSLIAGKVAKVAPKETQEKGIGPMDEFNLNRLRSYTKRKIEINDLHGSKEEQMKFSGAIIKGTLQIVFDYVKNHFQEIKDDEVDSNSIKNPVVKALLDVYGECSIKKYYRACFLDSVRQFVLEIKTPDERAYMIEKTELVLKLIMSSVQLPDEVKDMLEANTINGKVYSGTLYSLRYQQSEVTELTKPQPESALAKNKKFIQSLGLYNTELLSLLNTFRANLYVPDLTEAILESDNPNETFQEYVEKVKAMFNSKRALVNGGKAAQAFRSKRAQLEMDEYFDEIHDYVWEKRVFPALVFFAKVVFGSVNDRRTVIAYDA